VLFRVNARSAVLVRGPLGDEAVFRDLVQERQETLEAVLEIDHVPAGMELFPASDDAAWQLIKEVRESSASSMTNSDVERGR